MTEEVDGFEKLPAEPEDLDDEGFDDDADEEEVEADGAEMQLYPAQFYGMKIPKGNIGNMLVTVWDNCSECTGDKCRLYAKCPYYQDKIKVKRMLRLQKEGKSLGQCRVEQKFLHYTLKPFWPLLQKVPDDFVMQIVGLHLIPLYHDLVQLLMKKASLKPNQLAYLDAKGIARMHPVYDQLEKTHKAIISTWKSSGLQAIAKEAGFLQPPVDLNISEDDDYGIMAKGVK